MTWICPEPPSWSTGARVTGRAILAALTPLGVRATLTDDSPSALTSYAQNGVAVIDAANAVERITDFDLVVTSPGLPPTAPVLAAAAAAGVPIWGDVELAWRLDNSGRYGPAAALAGGDRHQRQDHHDVDAARDAGRRRSPRPALRQYR